MKEQSNAGIRDNDFDYMRYREQNAHHDSIGVPKKQFQSNNQFNLGYGRTIAENQCNETLILETQAALKSLSGSWSGDNTSIRPNNIEESSVFRNLFDEKSVSKRMSPITTTAFNANESSTSTTTSSSQRDLYYLNGKPKSGSQSKKPRLSEDKFQSPDFNELVAGSNASTNQTDKLTLHGSDKSDSVYENNSEYQTHRAIQPFSQSSAFHPPMFDAKKSNSFGSMSHSAYNYTDSSGYSTYSSMDINASSNSSPEQREQRPFGKTFTKDDDINAADYKEYTTLQPAGVGSKAASVIQDVTREGVASVVVMNSMTNNSTSASNTTPTAPTSNERAFFERPMAAFSPGSNNRGKTISKQNKCLLHV